MIINRKDLYSLVSRLCQGEYAIGMHGINHSRMNELDNVDKSEGVESILNKGLKVYSGRTINGTVRFFGRIDLKKDKTELNRGLANYVYGSDELIIVAIPTIIRTKDGRKIFLGSPNLESKYKNQMGSTGYETTTLLEDVILENEGSGIAHINPEYILGSCKLLDNGDIDFRLNPHHISSKNGIVSDKYYDEIIKKVHNILFSKPKIDISIFEKYDTISEEQIRDIIRELERKMQEKKDKIFIESEEAFICETLQQLLQERNLTNNRDKDASTPLASDSSILEINNNNPINLDISKIQKESDFLRIYRYFLQLTDEEEQNKFLKNDDFIIAAIKFLDKRELSTFFFINHSCFNQGLLDRIEIIKPLSLKVNNAIKYSKLKNNLAAMREIASQPGIKPSIINYVDQTIRNDYQFIENIITNTDDISDFYGHSAASLEGSDMRYGEVIGKNIQTNPKFWELLNIMLKKKTNKNKVFDVKKEIEIAKKYFSITKEKEVERTTFNNDEGAISIILKKGEYYGIKNTYYVKYDYPNLEQARYMFDVFEKKLIPAIGSSSSRVRNNVDFIMPYLVDEFGEFTPKAHQAKGIGGTNVPEDVLYEFIRRMVELDRCVVRCGDIVMKGTFSPEIYESMISLMNSKKHN